MKGILVAVIICWGAILGGVMVAAQFCAEPARESKAPVLVSATPSMYILEIPLPEQSKAVEVKPPVNTEAVVDTDKIDKTDDTYQRDLELLAKVINAEMGANWVPDEVQRKVGSVVLNRVNSDQFPNSLYEVVYQKDPSKQYACAWNGALDKPVTEKVWANAEYLMEHGSILPENVLYQSTNPNLGSGVHSKYYDSVMNNTTYFCYQ